MGSGVRHTPGGAIRMALPVKTGIANKTRYIGPSRPWEIKMTGPQDGKSLNVKARIGAKPV